MNEEDPVTVSMVAAGSSALLAAGSSVVGGIQAQKAGQVAAEQAANEAQTARTAAGAQISAEETNAGRELGKVAAGAGAAGITAQSAQPILSEDYTQAKIRSAYLRFNGQLGSVEDLYQGQLAQYQGNQALIGGLVGGASSILGGASSIGKIGIAKGWGTLGGTP